LSYWCAHGASFLNCPKSKRPIAVSGDGPIPKNECV
jgi:hypothetical protein